MPRKQNAPPAPPKGLGPQGRALWRAIADAYELRPDEEAILRQACHTEDVLAGLRAKKQPDPREVRMQADLLRKLLRSIDFATDGAPWEGLSASARASKAARHRHHRR